MFKKGFRETSQKSPNGPWEFQQMVLCSPNFQGTFWVKVDNTLHKSRLTPKKWHKKKTLLLLASMGKTGLSHDIFFKFSVGPFKVIEVEWPQMVKFWSCDLEILQSHSVRVYYIQLVKLLKLIVTWELQGSALGIKLFCLLR